MGCVRTEVSRAVRGAFAEVSVVVNGICVCACFVRALRVHAACACAYDVCIELVRIACA